jgi:5-(carboxyamino)imidazole ribonucleotide synthase
MKLTAGTKPTLGILGGGQLARMLALAARPLDIDCVVLEPAGADCPAAPVADVIVGAFSDRAALEELVRRCDVVTVELEAVPTDTIDWLSTYVSVRPGVAAVRASQDRLLEKQMIRYLEIPTAPFGDEVAESQPAIVKTRRGGYDGRGQIRTSTPLERAQALRELADPIVEGLVPFRRELSIVAARSFDGDIACYPLVENLHLESILRETTAPAAVTEAQQKAGESIAARLLAHLGYVGVIGIELFDVDGELVVNEFAPRVHNTGHWTIEGALTSQFEQHVRAVMGLPLGDPSPRGVSVMINAIGALPDLIDVLRVPGCHMHAYGKEERPGRKVGHITVTAETLEVLDERLTVLRKFL